ncbi:MAG: fasciclin domain-containing protein, partial [Acidimicrobiia bacterium]|nr:fasciclin domain-containing protein [Acidimicrobiia bacterium]
MNRIARLTLMATLAFVAVGCDDDDDMMTPAAVDIVATAEAAGSFNTLVAALDAAGLRTTLETGGPFTVFAPTDAAFDALPAGTVDALLADPDALAEILLFHVAEGSLASGDVASTPLIVTLNGQALMIDAGPTVNGAVITSADIDASNGVIHVIDAVLLPAEETITDIAAANT